MFLLLHTLTEAERLKIISIQVLMDEYFIYRSTDLIMYLETGYCLINKCKKPSNNTNLGYV